MPEAWGITTGSSDVVVAVIDTPTDLSLPDLDGTLWTNPGETPGDGIDNDGNGYVDDVHGWDFATNQPVSLGPFSHGAPVAGIALAETDNTTDIAGIAGGRPGASGARLMVLTWQPAPATFDQQLADALDYAREQGADVVNMSLVTDGAVAFEAAVGRATAAGMVLIAASGNGVSATGGDGTSDPSSTTPPIDEPANTGVCPPFGAFPGKDPGVLSVGATLIGDDRWPGSCPFAPFSQSGTELVAPGGDDIPTLASSGGTVSSFGGTSAAAPHAAEVAALLLSVNPSLTRDQVYEALVVTADSTGCVEIDPGMSYGQECGAGRLDAYAALAHVVETHGATFTQDVTIPAGETWDLGDVTLAFAPGTQLIVRGTLLADGTTFTASDVSQGWAGIRFKPGADGVVQNGVIEKVGGWGEYAVWIRDATVALTNW